MLTTAKPIFSTLRAGLMASALALALTACGTTNWGFPYRPDVQQGNWITSEQVAQLQKGMSREQVRFILGTPTLQDVFRTNRWDYPYYNKPGYGEEQERKFTVWFDGDSLVRWEGDQQPDRQPFQRSDSGVSETADTQGKISSDTAGSDTTPEQAQTSPIIGGSSAETNPSDQGKTATDADSATQDTQAQEAAPVQPRRPLINATDPRTTNPGAPNPGRSNAEPLR